MPGPDGKERVWRGLRVKMYRRMLEWLREVDERMPLYICMEPAGVWEKVVRRRPADREVAHRLVAGPGMKSTTTQRRTPANGGAAAKRAGGRASAQPSASSTPASAASPWCARSLSVLPHEHLIYLGDTGRYPYGTKSAETVRRYSIENAAFLADKGIKMLVVACNTAGGRGARRAERALRRSRSSASSSRARAPPCKRTRNRKVGVIGTEGTIASGAYTRALQAPRRRARDLHARLSALRAARRGGVGRQRRRAQHGSVVPHQPAAQRHRHARARLHALSAARRRHRRGHGRQGALVDSARTTARSRPRDPGPLRALARASGRGSSSFFVTDVPDRFVKVGARFMGQPVESAVRIER